MLSLEISVAGFFLMLRRLYLFKVLITKPEEKTKVHLATDLTEPVILHWALSKKPGEWLVRYMNLLIMDIVILQFIGVDNFALNTTRPTFLLINFN